MNTVKSFFRKNRNLLIITVVLIVLLFLAERSLGVQDWVITLLRSLSVASVTFLVASGFSLIFGLLDVLNLAHGTLFMIGAYVAWTVYIRPDTFLDLVTPFCFIAAGFTLLPVWDFLASRLTGKSFLSKVWPWAGLVSGAVVLMVAMQAYPITVWDPNNYSASPITFSVLAETGTRLIPPAVGFMESNPFLVLFGILMGSLILWFSFAGLQNSRNQGAMAKDFNPSWKHIILLVVVLAVGLLVYFFNTPLTTAIVGLGSNWLFLFAIVIALLVGILLGSLIETTMIRPLYSRPVYQMMITLGLSAVGLELVKTFWGRPEFTMPRPVMFNGTGENCPATTISALFTDHCSTIIFMNSRIRVYNEIFIPIIGIVILIAIWLLIKRTRIGMIIRAGVQDREMVEALGINVRRVFTFVFALGVGLATLGGALAAPSMGVSMAMGESMILNALIALAIGGLTSYPGAAVGSLMVGLIQQFIIKYGQVGITLPFLKEPFKPSPPLVPASTVLLMVIILLISPQGLLGRKE